MSHFCCPVCKQPLFAKDRALCCENGHNFDKARSGYVNLFRCQQSAAKRHGDDKRMLIARREFLNRGFYALLKNLLCDCVCRYTPENGVLLDAGCGEGYYMNAVAKTMPSLRVCGVDISKDALQMAAARSKQYELAVASLFSLPLADDSLDTVINVFAPCPDAEFARILKPHGILIRVIPTEMHLFGLKAAIYKQPRANKPERLTVDGFTMLDRKVLHDELVLTDPEDIKHLFEMTPYYYKTGQEDQQRLQSTPSLCTEIGFAVLIYKNNKKEV